MIVGKCCSTKRSNISLQRDTNPFSGPDVLLSSTSILACKSKQTVLLTKTQVSLEMHNIPLQGIIQIIIPQCQSC